MAHPQSSDGEHSLRILRVAAKAVDNSRQEVVLQLVDWARGYNVKRYTRYDVLNRTYGLDSLKRPKQWKENGRDYVDWISLAQNWKKWRAIVRTIMNLRVTQNARNFLEN